MIYRAGTAPLALVSSSLLVAVLACNFPSVELPPPGGEAPSQPSESVATAPEATPTPELVMLDACSLLSQDEVESILGGPMEEPDGSSTGSCGYRSGTSMISISAAQGEEAKDFVLLGPVLIAFLLSEDSDEAKLLEQLRVDAAGLSVGELFRRSLPIYEVTPLRFQPLPELGDEVYWSWGSMDPEGSIKSGTLVRFDGDTYLSCLVFAPDENTARQAAERMIALAAERLPARFSVTEDGTIKLQYGSTPEPSVVPP